MPPPQIPTCSRSAQKPGHFNDHIFGQRYRDLDFHPTLLSFQGTITFSNKLVYIMYLVEIAPKMRAVVAPATREIILLNIRPIYDIPSGLSTTSIRQDAQGDVTYPEEQEVEDYVEGCVELSVVTLPEEAPAPLPQG